MESYRKKYKSISVYDNINHVCILQSSSTKNDNPKYIMLLGEKHNTTRCTHVLVLDHAGPSTKYNSLSSHLSDLMNDNDHFFWKIFCIENLKGMRIDLAK